MPSKSSESLWVSTNHRVCIWLSVATTVPKHRWQRWWNQAIKKALNPSALASLEHLHDAWQRSEQAEGVEYDAGGFSTIASLGWWSHDDIVPYQVQIEKMWPPQFQIKIWSYYWFDCRSKETTQWYSSLLQNGAVPESNDVQCVRLQAPMATGICRHLGFGRTHWQVVSSWFKYSTLWLFNIAMENGPFIVDFPIKNGDFPWLC